MIGDLETQSLRDGRLALLDTQIRELLDLAAVQADNMVMMGAVQLEDRIAALEVVSGHKPRGLELCEHTVDCRHSHILMRLE